MNELERQWLSALYDESAAVVLAVAEQIVRNRSEAEDLLQDTFAAALRLRETFDERRGSQLSWVLAIVRSKALDRVRRHRVRTNAAHLLRPAEAAEPANDVLENARLNRCVARLPETQRQILLLAYFEGFTQSEIAARLGVPLGSVKTWARAALNELAQRLDGGPARAARQ